MIRHFRRAPYVDLLIPCPTPQRHAPSEERRAGVSAAERWKDHQDDSLNRQLKAEAELVLPVEDYPFWTRELDRWQAVSRHRWEQIAQERGWPQGELSSSLRYMRPDLANELDVDSEENWQLVPRLFELRVTAPQSLWWRCCLDESHRWRTSPANRHTVGTGCPRCSKKGTSQREAEIAQALQRHLPALRSPGTVPRTRHRVDGRRLRSWRVDMLLGSDPEVVIEYDGHYWHKKRQKWDRAKTDDIRASGRLVVRIRETPLGMIGPHDMPCPPRPRPRTRSPASSSRTCDSLACACLRRSSAHAMCSLSPRPAPACRTHQCSHERR